jgi:hypothetical protein
MKSFRLYIGEYGTLGTHEATDVKDYRMPIEIVRQLRNRLLNEQVLREPILNIFQGVYNDDTNFPDDLKANNPVADQVSNKFNIRKIKPRPPTDNDIIDFLFNSFPDLYLVNYPPSSESETVVWGETSSGRSQVNIERVSINAELTDVWLKNKCESSHFLRISSSSKSF